MLFQVQFQSRFHSRSWRSAETLFDSGHGTVHCVGWECQADPGFIMNKLRLNGNVGEMRIT